MLLLQIPLGVVFLAWTLATALAVSAEGQSAAPECHPLEPASPHCAGVLQETSRSYNAALAFERRGARKLALETYSQAIESAKQPIEFFLADTIPAAALRRRGMMHRELGQLPEAMVDFTTLINADRGNSDARHERARTLLELGRLDDALVDSEAAVWLKPHISDFHTVHAQVLARLGRQKESERASIQAEKYAPPSQLTELERALKGIGPKLSEESSREVAKTRGLQEFELALRGIAPMAVRQRFMLQRDCQDDDRHVLSLRINRGQVSARPSYEAVAATMTVEDLGERLLFVLGAERCQVRVVLGKGDLSADVPPASNGNLRKLVSRESEARHIDREFYPASTHGCAGGAATVRVYWGSVDHSYLVQQARKQARLGPPARPRNKELLFTLSFGEESCQITLQAWKGAS